MENKNIPYKRIKKGRFQISFFKSNRFISPRSGYHAELAVEQIRVCLQYSYFSNYSDKWIRQKIWCSPDELHDLYNAISSLNE